MPRKALQPNIPLTNTGRAVPPIGALGQLPLSNYAKNRALKAKQQGTGLKRKFV